MNRRKFTPQFKAKVVLELFPVPSPRPRPAASTGFGTHYFTSGARSSWNRPLCCSKKKLALSGHSYRRYPNLVEGFETNYPDQVWVADITCIRLREVFCGSSLFHVGSPKSSLPARR